jgi:hypothetical protein
VTADPLRLVWDALQARDCRPRGHDYDFRARCPVHGGDNPSSLHVSVGADRRVVLWCFAHQCSVDDVTVALGLTVADLFPDGHHRARRLPSRAVRRPDFKGAALGVANALYSLEELDEAWQVMLTSRCPYCDSPGAWLRGSSHGRIDADCPSGCDSHAYTQALLARVHESKGRRR